MDSYVLRPRTQVIGAAIINIAMALWLIGAPYALEYDHIEAAAWNALIVGLLVIVVAIVRIRWPARTAQLSFLTIALGVWLAAAPFMLGNWATRRAWSNGIVAIVVVSEATVSLVFGRKTARERSNRRPTQRG